jgi:hypothetical protein
LNSLDALGTRRSGSSLCSLGTINAIDSRWP